MNNSIKKLALIYESLFKPSETGAIRKVYARIETLVKSLYEATDFEMFRRIALALHEAEKSFSYRGPTDRSTKEEIQYQIEKLTGQKLTDDFTNPFRIPNDLTLLETAIKNEAQSLYAAYLFTKFIGERLYVDPYSGQQVQVEFAKKVFDMHRSLTAAREQMRRASDDAKVELDI
jgi:hypothetical protein